jgi:signal transduction histidine kinase
MTVDATPVPPESAEILIVDDTINNLKLLSDMLTSSGFCVRKARNGVMALTAVTTKHPDLILLDIKMPQMDGYEVCRHLQADSATQSIPIIFLSALDDAFDKVKAFDLGAVDYVTKPFQKTEVLKRIQHQLRLQYLTRRLNHQNETLEEALKYLKENQAEIVQKAKILSLNQLIAGIAHEINNPVGFIAGNLSHLQDYFGEVANVIKDHHQKYPDLVAADAKSELDFILEDWPRLFQSMASGADRIDEIVQALKTFSHHGEAGMKPIDLHQTLDSTLVLLKSRLQTQAQRPEINMVRDYGSLAEVRCDAKLIGQVFWSLLNNAIDAINRLWDPEQTHPDAVDLAQRSPEIVIKTRSPESAWVDILIGDNGIGITEEVKNRIYDPFFSTKPVGDGHGLGLSMSYQIIAENHQGSLSVESVPLQGSQFLIRLPLNPGYK